MPLPHVPSKLIYALVAVAGIVIVGTVAASTVLSAESAGLVNVEVTEGNTNLVEVPAGRQIVLVQRHGKAERLCAGRGPDLGMNMSEGVSLGSDGKTLGENDTITATDLGGRTERVLLAREILYRACEIGMNHNTSLEESRTLYQEALQAIVALDRPESPPGAAAEQGGQGRKE